MIKDPNELPELFRAFTSEEEAEEYGEVIVLFQPSTNTYLYCVEVEDDKV